MEISPEERSLSNTITVGERTKVVAGESSHQPRREESLQLILEALQKFSPLFVVRDIMEHVLSDEKREWVKGHS